MNMASSAHSSSNARNVLIHVFDEYRKQAKDFICQRELLLAKMKYFQAYLNQSNENDEIDISVHCDVEVFEWLVQYMTQSESEWRPRISLENIASILVSSEFLQMDTLVDECVEFIVSKMQEFVQLRVDFGCLSDTTITKIAQRCTVEALQKLHDPKDKILSKLQKKKLDYFVKTLQENGRQFFCCQACGLLYLEAYQEKCICAKGTRYIGQHGELIAQHQPKRDWSIADCVQELLVQKEVPWVSVFWYLWAATQCRFCTSCKKHYTLLEQKECHFHHGSLNGVGVDPRYSCCGAKSFHIDDPLIVGCKVRDHVTPDPSIVLQQHGIGRAPANLQELVSVCSSLMRPPSSVGGDGGHGLRLQDLFDPPPPSPVDELDAEAAMHVKKTLSDTTSPRRRRQWKALQLQEKDRVRFQLMTKKLVALRKNLAS